MKQSIDLRTGFQTTLSGSGGRPTGSKLAPALLRTAAPSVTIPTNDNGVALELTPNRSPAWQREAVGSAGRLTPEEIEAGRALCTMLDIDLEEPPDERLEQLRKLWK